LQLPNYSALGLEVNPEAYSVCFETKKNLVFNFGDDLLISTLITKVVSNLRTSMEMNLKHYMQNGLSIYQTKYCMTTFLALHAYPT